MTTRVVSEWTCDLCGRQVPGPRHGYTVQPLGRGRGIVYVDIGRCCAHRTIAELVAASLRLTPR